MQFGQHVGHDLKKDMAHLDLSRLLCAYWCRHQDELQAADAKVDAARKEVAGVQKELHNKKMQFDSTHRAQACLIFCAPGFPMLRRFPHTIMFVKYEV